MMNCQKETWKLSAYLVKKTIVLILVPYFSFARVSMTGSSSPTNEKPPFIIL